MKINKHRAGEEERKSLREMAENQPARDSARKHSLRWLHPLLPHPPTCTLRRASTGHPLPPELVWVETQKRVGFQWPAYPLTQLSHSPRFQETEVHENRSDSHCYTKNIDVLPNLLVNSCYPEYLIGAFCSSPLNLYNSSQSSKESWKALLNIKSVLAPQPSGYYAIR